MNAFFSYIKRIAIASFFLAVSNTCAHNLTPDDTDQSIKELYHTINNNLKRDMPSRLKKFSAEFFGKPYVLFALGEGEDATFDQLPRYRVDAFDCETYVDTVVALALADNPETFKQCINKIRYQDGKASFQTRNHFTGLDWNRNNQKQGFFKDVTFSIKNRNHQTVAKMAIAVIDKPSWYRHLSADRIKLFPENVPVKNKRLRELRDSGHTMRVEQETVPYLPFTALFDEQGNPDAFLFAQIPEGSIIEIVRPDWDVKKIIGTHLNVSHLGFAFWSNGELRFRQASSQLGKVVDVSLVDYLKNARGSATIKGINVQVLVPEQPFHGTCSD